MFWVIGARADITNSSNLIPVKPAELKPIKKKKILKSATVTSASANSIKIDIPSETSKAEKELAEQGWKKPAAKWFGHIRFESQNYLTTLPEAPSLTNSQFLSARFQGASTYSEQNRILFAGDFAAGTLFTKGQSHFAVNEVFVGAKATDSLNIYAGRRRAIWNEADGMWDLTLWQPRFYVDALRPQAQGLTGFLFDYHTQSWSSMIFISPFFIPSSGPAVREEGGGLVSDSRWYREPNRDFKFGNNVNTIYYRIDVPEISKLVVNPSMAVQGTWGDRSRGPFVSAATAYKPVNELLLKRQNFKEISTDKVDVTVSPDVTYHSLNSLDVGYGTASGAVVASYIVDNPQTKMPDEDWIIQKLEPSTTMSVNANWDYLKFNRLFQFAVGYLKINGGTISDITSNGTPDDQTMFTQRFRFYDSARFTGRGPIADFGGKSLSFSFTYQYDWAQRGSWINSEFNLNLAPSWVALLGFDVLGVENPAQNSSDFFSQYRANDRVYGGMTYVF